MNFKELLGLNTKILRASHLPWLAFSNHEFNSAVAVLQFCTEEGLEFVMAIIYSGT